MANVICPKCRGRYHETTEHFNPDILPHGAMFKLLKKYGSHGFNWSTFQQHKAVDMAQLVCPSCGGEYLNSKNRVTLDADDALICEQCGKKCKSLAGLQSHMRSHEQ